MSHRRTSWESVIIDAGNGIGRGDGGRLDLDLEGAAEDIDQLITMDMNRRGVVRRLYEAARKKTGKPLVQAAAETLFEATSRGSHVLIATGWPDRPWITPAIGELDGPPGAALLGRSLHDSCGAVPVFLVEEQLIPAMTATARAAGLAVLSTEEAAACVDSPAPLHACSVLSFPADEEKAKTDSDRLIEELNPTAVAAVEKGSANTKGVIHNARGMDTSSCMAKVDELVKRAQDAGIPSVGVGDGGNEIGMGMISDAIREHIPYGDKCACPCGGGIAPEIETDVLVVSTVSNWGAYGTAACLALVTGNQDVLHDPSTELRTLREAADAGLIDGNTGYVTPGADGLSAETHAAMITILRQIVSNALSPKGLARDCD